MKILVVHPGASMSTSDVYDGLVGGLRARGHAIWDYALDARIERSGAWLTHCWRRGGKKLPQPNASDILYHAGEELVARSLRVMPDLVLIVSAMYLHPDVLLLLKRTPLKVAVLFTESPYDDERQVRLLPFVDAAWTNERWSARALTEVAATVPGAAPVGYLPHAWNPDRQGIAGPVDDAAPAHDVVFVGTGFEERIETLAAIDFDGLDFGLYGSWDLLGSRHKLRKHLRDGYVDNAYATMLYRKAKIGLNLYRLSKGFGKDAPRITHAESLNPRAYELAAAGCVTVSDARAEVAEIFGDAVPTFSDPREVRPLVDRLLADPEGLARRRGLLPGLVRDHTWHARAAQMEAELYGAGIVAGHIHQEPDAGAARAVAGG